MTEPTPPGLSQQAELKTQPDAAKDAAQGAADTAAADALEAAASQRRRRVRIIVGAVLLIVVGLVIWRVFFATPALPASIVAVSGRIEGDDSAVASKTTGRILEVRVREGDSVNAGDIIATLDDAQIRAREDQAQDALISAEAKGDAARQQIAVLQQQLDQSQMQVGQSKFDTEGRVKQAEADLAAAKSDLAQQQAAYQIAAFDKDAYTRLAKTGAVSERQGLQAAATADQQANAVATAQRRVDAAQDALTTAQGILSNPGIRESQVALVKRQIAEQKAELASASAQTQQTHAQLTEAEDNRNDLTKVYLRGFVPEGDIGKVKVGQPARVYLDSNPRKPVDAYISRIDPQATFTPENTYFRDDRIKQVVGIKLQLTAGFGFAKPGMPVDGEVLVQGNVWPKVSHK